jgi:hypothetical protein
MIFIRLALESTGYLIFLFVALDGVVTVVAVRTVDDDDADDDEEEDDDDDDDDINNVRVCALNLRFIV